MNFLPLAVALISGIYSSQYLPQTTVVTVASIFICISFITFRINKKLRIDVSFAIITFIVGIFLFNFGSNPKEGNEYDGCYVMLHGVVCSLPYESNGINRYTIYADELDFDGTKHKFSSKVLVNSHENFKCGDSVVVFGQLNRIISRPSDNVFISRNYYASKDIFFKTTALTMTNSDNECQYFSLPYYGNLLRSKCATLIRSHYSGDIAAAMIAVMTGDKHSFSDEYNEVLEYTGTRHLFYPAFIHISMMSFFIGMFSLVVPRRIRDFSLVIMLSLYVLFAVSASSIKAASVLIIVILCKKLFGSGTYMNSLSLFALITGITNPMLFFDAGFVYSIASAIIIRTFSPVFYGKNILTRFLGKYLIFTAGTAPLALYLFGRISVYSFLVSFIFIPILCFILAISPLFVLNLSAGSVVPVAWIVHKFIMVLLHIPILIENLPFSYITLPKPSLTFIGAFYFAAAAIIYSHKKSDTNKRICIVISLGLFSSQLAYTISDFNKLRINFIDVGHADATLIQLPMTGNIIIDGGGAPDYSSYNIGEKVFVPYLTEHGANVIQAAFVSHYHKDHAEGVIAALKYLDVKNLFIPDVYPDNEIRLKLERLAKENGTKVHHISKPMRVRIADITIDIIPPSENVLFAQDENDTSLFINVQYGEFKALFTGDMTSYSESDLLAQNIVPDADVLKVAHHGSQTSSTAEFIGAVSPEYSLIGVGMNNEYAHPNKEVVSRLADSTILRTDTHGDIVLYADKNADIRAEYSGSKD